tara:strand:+ start:116 stop:610 length:495 start_codon:yes stop_codon:yes gene_type:complete
MRYCRFLIVAMVIALAMNFVLLLSLSRTYRMDIATAKVRVELRLAGFEFDQYDVDRYQYAYRFDGVRGGSEIWLDAGGECVIVPIRWRGEIDAVRVHEIHRHVEALVRSCDLGQELWMQILNEVARCMEQGYRVKVPDVDCEQLSARLHAEEHSVHNEVLSWRR